MMRQRLPCCSRRAAAAALRIDFCRRSSSVRSHLLRLDDKKAARSPPADRGAFGPDFERAQCFLQLGDAFHARQALLEELRLVPSNIEARRLLWELNKVVHPVLAPSNATALSEEPLFRMLYDALKDHTMLTWPRLWSLYQSAKKICEADIPGDVVECGVAGGGSVVFLAAVVQYFSSRPRRVFACDTFLGMPTSSSVDTVLVDSDAPPRDAASEGPLAQHWSTGTCRGSEEHVQALASAMGVDVTTVAGPFEVTLPGLPTQRIALLHADADWYESTKCVLTHAFPRLVRPGGVLQVDDYHYWSGCQRAVDEVLPNAQWHNIDGNAVSLTLT